MIKRQTEQGAYSTKVIDHLGLVAGMCEELKIGELIDSCKPNTSADKILSTGVATVGLILNGLGFVNQRLYLVSRFFENKPVGKLLNDSYLQAEHFNDDALGRSLDALYEFGVNKLYSIISSSVVNHLSAQYGLKVEVGQLDNTNFHLHGGEKVLKDETGQTILEIKQGYSKDHRPDLVQIGLQLIVESQSGIPLLMEVLSGNEEEAQSYGKCIKQYADQLQNEYGVDFIVVDSKLYTANNLDILSKKASLGWLTRVPNRLNVVKEVIDHVDSSMLQPLAGYEKYKYTEVGSLYAGVHQRWIVLQSEDQYGRDLKRLDKSVAKFRATEVKAYKKLTKQLFNTEEEVQSAERAFCNQLKYSKLAESSIVVVRKYSKAGKPKRGQQPDRICYAVVGKIQPCSTYYEQQKQKLGYFILATNQTDAQQIQVNTLLERYKNQSKVERSFRFLKDPKIVASSLFVQKPERMTAILMIMSLCLLVYAALQYVTRTLFKEKNLTVENQVKKQVQNPTMRWIFECFEGIHILYHLDNEPIVLNLKNSHLLIINLLGKNYLKYYT